MLLYNEVLVKTIFEKELILDGYLRKIELIFDSKIKVNFVIQKGDTTLNLFCKDVTNYLFTCPYDGDILIPSFKLFKENSGNYYLCFDPVSEVKERETDDTDFIVFRSFHAKILVNHSST